ncbi:hypothetical protein B0H13DRAFT_2269890 [Mycena leptocephala]|nr:hypothetical protein B0H13DRAFT_2269890 [Mycena leptocephala]
MKLLLGLLYVASLALLGLRLAHDTAVIFEVQFAFWTLRDRLLSYSVALFVPSKVDAACISYILGSAVTQPTNSVGRLHIECHHTLPYFCWCFSVRGGKIALTGDPVTEPRSVGPPNDAYCPRNAIS